MLDQTTPLVVRMTVTLRHDAGTHATTALVILPTSDEDARERAITMVCAAEGAPRRAVLSVAAEDEEPTAWNRTADGITCGAHDVRLDPHGWCSVGHYPAGRRFDTVGIAEDSVPGAWVIGHNLAGYLPESDTFAYPTWREAYNALADEACRYADEDDEAAEDGRCCDDHDGEPPVMRATVDSILADPSFGPGHDDGRDYGFTVADYYDRPIVFWLSWEPTRTAYDHEDD